MKINSEDLLFIKQQPIWTGCRKNPYIMRCGINVDCCLIYITNVKESWFCKLSRQQIIDDKEIYNKSIQTNSLDGILDLLKLALIFDQQAEYSYKLNGTSIFYGYSNVIKIYTLTWIFDCKLVDEEQHQAILTFDIINPLLLTVQSLDNRCLNYKTQLSLLEKDYLRRLNDREKQSYKPKELDEDLNVYILDEQLEENTLCQIDFTPTVNYFLRYYSMNKLSQAMQSKKRQPQLQEQQMKQSNKKEHILQAYEEAVLGLVDAKSQQHVDSKPQVDSKTSNKSKKIGFL